MTEGSGLRSGAHLSSGRGLLTGGRDSLHLGYQGRHHAAVIVGEGGAVCVCVCVCVCVH